MPLRIVNLLKALGHAANGWHRGLKERNVKIHLLAAICVFTAAVFFQISAVEWLIIIFLTGAVISAELFNTAIEEACDTMAIKLRLQYSDTTLPRDLAAGAVLIIVVTAAIVGLIIFVPKVLILLL